MGTCLRIAVDFSLVALFASCAQTVPVVSVPVLSLQTERPWQNGGSRAIIRLHLDRNGVPGDVRFQVVGLPDGVRAEEAVIPAGQTEAPLTLEARDFCFDSSAVASVEGEVGGSTVSSRLPLQALRVESEARGGRVSLSFQASGGTGVNVAPLETQSVYANFAGSACQVMMGSADRFLYVCFNGPVRTMKTYALGLERGAVAPGTASITYLESSSCNPSGPHNFWDSASGQLEVLEASASVIRFSIHQARMVPAEGFAGNRANASVTVQGEVEVTDIGNFPD